MQQPKVLTNEEFYNEIISSYQSGKIISESIRLLAEKFDLNPGSVKARWYKLVKSEEYANRFESDKEQVVSSPIEVQGNNHIEQMDSNVKDNLDLIEINIKFFNDFYLSIKDKPEVLSKLLIFNEMKTENEKQIDDLITLLKNRKESK